MLKADVAHLITSVIIFYETESERDGRQDILSWVSN